MGFFKPNKYCKDIYSINYDLLKKEGIKCLVFDLDNTLGTVTNKKCPEKTIVLLKNLQENFHIFVCSNNTKRRIEPYLKALGVNGVAWSFKPFTRGLRKIKKEYKFEKNQMIIIGDQILTDIIAGKRFKIKTILVDPLGKTDLKVTGFNRKLESYIIGKMAKKKDFERGKYYE